MSTRTVKQAIARATAPTSKSGAKVTLGEAQEIVAEARKGTITKTGRKAVKDLFETGELTKGAKAELSTFLEPGTQGLGALMPEDWRNALSTELASPSAKGLETFLDAESKTGKVFPPREQVFAALSQTPLKDVKVVVIGQDPYPTAGNANGLAFSVAPGMKVPASLKNIYEGLKLDTGAQVPKSGDLTPWAKQGVLLLNTVLTVREGAPNSHRGHGWEDLTRAMLNKVNEQKGPVVFLCFGKQAQEMAASLVDTKKHTILSAPHPSPLNGKAFVKAVEQEHLFTHTNQILKDGGRGAVEWQIK